MPKPPKSLKAPPLEVTKADLAGAAKIIDATPTVKTLADVAGRGNYRNDLPGDRYEIEIPNSRNGEWKEARQKYVEAVTEEGMRQAEVEPMTTVMTERGPQSIRSRHEEVLAASRPIHSVTTGRRKRLTERLATVCGTCGFNVYLGCICDV